MNDIRETEQDTCGFGDGAKSPEDRLTELISDGRLVESTSPNVDISKRPAYFDEQRFQRAQSVCKRLFTNLNAGSSAGLLILLQIESILVPLLKTGKSRTVPGLFDRYLATIKYIRKCYETNFYDQTSEGWRYINMVRGMHKSIHRLMKEDSRLPEHQSVWVNQHDMALTQFAFVGLFILKPIKCGAYHVSRQDLADVTYYWRLLSYYFGIEERFNIFVYHEELDQQFKYMSLMLDHIKGLICARETKIGVEMAKGVVLAFENFTPESTFNILDHWWSPDISLSGCKSLEPYSLTERFKVILFLFYFKVLFRSKLAMALMNWLYKKKLDKFVASSDKYRKRLELKYADLIFEE